MEEEQHRESGQREGGTGENFGKLQHNFYTLPVPRPISLQSWRMALTVQRIPDVRFTVLFNDSWPLKWDDITSDQIYW